MAERHAGFNLILPPNTPALATRGKKLEELLELAETPRSISANAPKRRADARFEMRGIPARVICAHPGGGELAWTAALVNMSELGCCILTPGYLHPTTACKIALTGLRGEAHEAVGTVKWCRHLCMSTHIAGVLLTDPVEVRQFVRPDVWLAALAASDTQQTAADKDPAEVICFSESTIELALYRLFFSESDTQVTEATSTGELLDGIKHHTFDAAMLDLDMDENSPVQLLASVREAGFRGPIVAAANDQEASAAVSCDPDAFSQFIVKPITEEAIRPALRTMLSQRPDNVERSDPIKTTMQSSGARSASLQAFIIEAQRIAAKSLKLVNAKRLDEAKRHCLQIASSAKGYGFGPVGDCAARVAIAIDSHPNDPNLANEVQKLIRFTDRMRCTDEDMVA